MLQTGPDGALWVADMYRSRHRAPGVDPRRLAGEARPARRHDKGRIYRVFPVDRKPRPIPRLDKLDTAGLVAALDSPNGWQRDTAQRLLLHRGDPAAIAPLRELVAHTESPRTRVQALWTLAGLGGLDESTALAALADPDPEVRRNASKAAGPLVSTSPRVAEAVLRLADDADARVRLQVAILLGDWHDPRAGRALARPGAPGWGRSVDASGRDELGDASRGDAGDGTLPRGRGRAQPGAGRAARHDGGDLPDRGAIESLARSIATPARPGGRFAPWQFSGLAGLLASLERRGKEPLGKDVEAQFVPLWDAARVLVRDDSAPEADRLPAVPPPGPGRREPSRRSRLARRPAPSPGPRRAPAGGRDRPRADRRRPRPRALPPGLEGPLPAGPSAILDALLARESWTSELLATLADGRVPPADIDPARRQRLLTHRDGELKARAEALFSHQATSRQRVVDAYRPALGLKGKPDAGAPLFKKLCASCHRLGNEGVEVGPDLATLNDRSPEALLIAILDPNRAFESKYAGFTVATDDGRILSGLISGETASAVTLRRQEGRDVVLLRSQIDEMAGSGQSLMPEGVEKDLTPQALADLIAFLGGLTPEPRG